MNMAYRMIFFLKSFSVGILMPVLSLFILARGASLTSLAWIVGIYSLTVVIMEFPSGVFCDLFGKKRTFLISCFLMLLSFGILFLFPYVFGALIGFFIQGIARAFASGSLDSLVIRQSMKNGGEKALAKTNGELGILESAGIAFGSLFGGILADTGTHYQNNLLCMLLIYILITALVILYVQETFRKNTEASNSLKKQAGESISYTLHTPDLMMLMILSFITGMAIFTIETYWQPQFTALPGTEGSWKLGIVTFCGFFFTALGSQLISLLLAKSSNSNGNRWQHIFFLTKFTFAAALLIFSGRTATLPYIFNYCILYLFLGGSSVVENSLFGKLVPEHFLSSIMSLFSLVFQAGALFSSALCGILLNFLNIRELWFFTGCFFVIITLLILVTRYRNRLQFYR